MIDKKQTISPNKDQKQNHEEFLLNILNNLQPTKTMSKQQLFRIQLTMGFTSTLICGGVCRLYLSNSKDNKWKNANIEGGLIVCIDKDMNYAPLLRIFDLNTFKIRFEIEMFPEFDKCILLANPQFVVIKLPQVDQNYLGLSFGDANDTKLIHEIITYITQIKSLPELFSLPNIQELLVRRNHALQRKDNNGKYGRSPERSQIQQTTLQEPILLAGRKQQFQQSYQAPINQSYSNFWGNQQRYQLNKEPLQGGRVSNTQSQFNNIEHQPNDTQRGDLFHGDPNLILFNHKQQQNQYGSNLMNEMKQMYHQTDNQSQDDSSLDQYQQQKRLPKENVFIKTSTFGNNTQSIVLNTMTHKDQQQQINGDKPLSISNTGFDENSQVYDAKKIHPSLREIVQRAGIKPKELSDSTFAPILKALVLEAQQKSQIQQPSEMEIHKLKSDIDQSRTIVMPQSTIFEKIASQPKLSQIQSPDPNIDNHNHVAQNDINQQILQGVHLKQVVAKSPTQLTGSQLTSNEQQGLTLKLTHAIEERRKQMRKNDFESEEKSAWEDDN